MIKHISISDIIGGKVKNKKEWKYKEICIICHKILDVDKRIHIYQRCFYVEGAGQLCESCYKKIYHMES